MSPADPSQAALAQSTPLALTVQDALEEGRRLASICNACRYCEGYCAVFPALERRLEFADNDLRYLANLCHNCGACLTACQYAPPHEFALNLPRNLARIRAQAYRDFAWPAGLGSLYGRGVGTWLAIAAIFCAVFLAAMRGRVASSPGAFYDVMPHTLMALVFGAAGLFVAVALVAMFGKGWRDMGETGAVDGKAVMLAVHDAASLKHLGGGGEGCAAGEGPPSTLRRGLHHATAYGFALCFAATVVATFYHYVLRWPAPYPVSSLPVVLGIVGGVGLVVGTAGLAWLAHRRDREFTDPAQASANAALLLLLFLTSVTGLALLAWRDTGAMSSLLAIHLGIVLALFVAFAYGKFVHAVHRFAALLRYAVERRRPVRDLGGG
ncbi:MAG: tricarballylate utilization 4Fe-4S protein TcuB [Burkholderiales bacterium]